MTVMTNPFERTGANLHRISFGGIIGKSLKLVDMQAIDAETMARMFTKMKVIAE